MPKTQKPEGILKLAIKNEYKFNSFSLKLGFTILHNPSQSFAMLQLASPTIQNPAGDSQGATPSQRSPDLLAMLRGSEGETQRIGDE